MTKRKMQTLVPAPVPTPDPAPEPPAAPEPAVTADRPALTPRKKGR